jgi:hypothetical protein
MKSLNRKYIFFSCTAAVIVLWHLLLPGYVLTLDMVFGPHVPVPAFRDLSGSFPLQGLLYALSFVLPAWFIQKLLLFILFFLLFFLPLKFFPFEKSGRGEEYLASLLFVFNPFVYERFLAGQWNVIGGYLFLLPFITCLFRLRKEVSYRNVFKIFGFLFLIGVFSIHVETMATLILLFYVVFLCVGKMVKKEVKGIGKLFLRLMPGGFVFIIMSLYWIIPTFVTPQNRLETFTADHEEVFRTANDEKMGTLVNVATLYGFWGEHEEWIERFVLPKEHRLVFVPTALSLLSIVILGMCAGLCRKEKRSDLLFLAGIGLVSFVFSVGVGESFLKPLNGWLFDNLTFWKGFRDSQKWSGVVVMTYVACFALGGAYLLGMIKNEKTRRCVLVTLCLVPILYTPTMLFGLNGQLRAVWYPESWKQANDLLKKDANCKALFLPWHQYYSLKFNDDILSLNTSNRYFDCDVVSGQNMELGSIESQAGNTEEYYEIEKVVTSNESDPEEVVLALKKQGIKWVIFTSDLEGEDAFIYPFVSSNLLRKVSSSKALDLYEVL